MPQAALPLFALLLLLAGPLAPSAGAQDEDTPEARPDARLDPVLTDPSLDDQMRQRTSRPLAATAIRPTRRLTVGQVEPNQPADTSRLRLADGSEAWIKAGTLRPEGTFLVGWTGEVVELRTGGLAFLPVAERGGKPEPAMAMLPCSVYSRIASLLNGEQRGLWLSLTGEVLEYHGRNYLLPTALASAREPGLEGEPDAAAEAPEGAPPGDESGVAGAQPEAGDQPAEDDGRIDELVRGLEADRAERRGIETAFDTLAQDDTEGGAVGPRIEGRMLLGQRARMVRSGEGGWVIAIDNDRASPELELPHHLRLLPCRLVGQMEKQAERQGEGWSFEVSGTVYRHGASVYLLPRMFVTIAGEDVEPLQ
jgi:hypothetical protein